jgi:hypothetical protein
LALRERHDFSTAPLVSSASSVPIFPRIRISAIARQDEGSG